MNKFPKWRYLLSGVGFLSMFAMGANAEELSSDPNSSINPTQSSAPTLFGRPSQSGQSVIDQVRYRQGLKQFNANPDAGMTQVTSVSELRDVQPDAWAYEALKSLVERYGCIVGYPDRTFRGDRAISRYEFAAGLNACMNVMERLIQENVAVLREDIDKLKRLMQQFEEELTMLSARVDNLETRIAYLEDHQFSTTTKLVGEVAFQIAQAFGDDINNGTGQRDLDSQVVMQDKVRLQFVTSFTGKDQLFTRLTAGSIGNSFQDEIGDFQGRFAYDGPDNNDVTIDRLHYYFPVGDNLRIFTMASLGGHHFYADTFNAGLDVGGGANGALSRFAERNPIYRIGLGGQGIGATYDWGENFQFSAGYLARGGNSPNQERGLFNGNYSLMGQAVYKPTNRIKFGATYINAYDPDGLFRYGGTGTRPANFLLNTLGTDNSDVSSNSYGLQGQFDITPSFSLRAWGGYTSARLIGQGGGDVWNYAMAMVFPDLFKEGSMGYLMAGAEPYLGGLNVANQPTYFNNSTPFHIEAAYKYAFSDNITLTPGIIVLTAPNQDSRRNDTVYIGVVRGTYSF